MFDHGQPTIADRLAYARGGAGLSALSKEQIRNFQKKELIPLAKANNDAFRTALLLAGVASGKAEVAKNKIVIDNFLGIENNPPPSPTPTTPPHRTGGRQR